MNKMISNVGHTAVWLLLVSVLPLVACQNGREKDDYLRSLKMKPVFVSPVDSFDLECFGVFYPTELYKSGDWFLLHDSAPKKTCAAVLVNPSLAHENRIELMPVGRGPGENVNPGGIFGPESSPMIFDWGSRIQVRVDIPASAEAHAAVLDTVGDFSAYRWWGEFWPVQGGYLIQHDDNWYALFDGTEIVSPGNRPSYEVLTRVSRDQLVNYLGDTRFTVSPSGERFCCTATMSATLSFSRIENGELLEIKRYEAIPPRFGSGATFTADSQKGVQALSSDEQYVYALYSGKPLVSSDAVPSWECSHLVVYDWDGNPVKRYLLQHAASGIALSDGSLYCTTTYPEARILRYELKL